MRGASLWFLLLHLWCVSRAGRTEPDAAAACPPNLSVAIPDDEYDILQDGRLIHHAKSRSYPARSHWHDGKMRRGCICHVSESPCLRKCCDAGQSVLTSASPDDPGHECVPDPDAPKTIGLSEDIVSSGMQAQLEARPGLHDWFTLVESPKCADNHSAMLLNPVDYPQEDRYTLNEDGSLSVAVLGSLPVGRFCMDHRVNTTSEIAVITCLFTEEHKAKEEEDRMDSFHTVGYVLSLPFLAVTFVVYAIIPELRNIYGKTLMCYVISLLSAYIFMVVSSFLEYPACIVIAYIVHFSFLASFFWLNVMCFDIWWTFGGFRSLHGSVKQRERKKFIMYSIYAWGCATVITTITMIMDLVPGIPDTMIRPEFGKGSCWFETAGARALYFYGPMGLTIICNICLFILTAVKIIKHKKDTARQLKGSDSRRHDDNKQWFNLYLKLFIVMGINWSMEIISWMFEDILPKYVWYLTDLTNTLQGVIIFIIFVWKDKIRRLLMKRFGCDGDGLFRNSTSRSGCATSSTSARTTCITSGAPLQEKVNPYIDSYARGKSTVTDDSDCI
ncbi:probable G-protein coupled receptor Mth-like 3 isoform X2 [Phymastichus coffea]|uniref:probable G-protein coupled receptor Mth-like 3 isoform X2 n=1 Tax=Phymastichus coffea TaxID=108790 RepID=UPI00273AC7AF|nr:probable G-protein coupled receptor Mth-like 3 isoform X2 [Phymastichus coffea]